MLGYTIVEWLFFFYIYCFIGWCFESAYVSLRKKRFVNRGFISGPFLPLYGSGAVMMLVVSMPFSSNLPLTFLAGVIGATLLEYVTGICMETLFKVRYWDYSNQKFNFKGYICLSSSIAWGFLTILMTRVIHKPIEGFMLAIPKEFLIASVFILTIYIAVDFAMAFRTALDLRDILMYMEKGKEELERMQKRLDVIIAVVDDTKEGLAEEIEQRKEQFLASMDSRKQAGTYRTDELANRIEENLTRIKKAIQEKPSEYLESIRDEVSEIRGKYSLHLEKRKQFKIQKELKKRKLILGNPSMKSKKYNDLLEELRNEIQKSRKK